MGDSLADLAIVQSVFFNLMHNNNISSLFF
jgi:hypothetical protein